MTMVLLDYQGLKARGVTFSKSQLRRKVEDGTFPLPAKLSDKKLAWPAAEIDDWIKAKLNERQGYAAG